MISPSGIRIVQANLFCTARQGVGVAGSRIVHECKSTLHH